MAEPLRGRVAKVLTSRELVLNRGSADGVAVGMRFAVLDPLGENVKDPETGEVLGSISRPKIRVEVTRVEPRLSLASTYRKVTVNEGGLGLGRSALSQVFEPPRYVEKYETFKSSDQSWEALPESESLVKVGDPVVQISRRESELSTPVESGESLSEVPSAPPKTGDA